MKEKVNHVMSKELCSSCETEEEQYLCCVDQVGITVKKLVRSFQLFERDQVKPLGFTMTQCYCLIELLENDGLTMNELSDRMNLNTSTMTRVIDKLVRDKLVKRNRSSEDRRVVIASLTEVGVESASNAQETIKSYYETITRNLPKNRIDEVLESVAMLITAFEKANPDCC